MAFQMPSKSDPFIFQLFHFLSCIGKNRGDPYLLTPKVLMIFWVAEHHEVGKSLGACRIDFRPLDLIDFNDVIDVQQDGVAFHKDRETEIFCRKAMFPVGKGIALFLRGNIEVWPCPVRSADTISGLPD